MYIRNLIGARWKLFYLAAATRYLSGSCHIIYMTAATKYIWRPPYNNLTFNLSGGHCIVSVCRHLYIWRPQYNYLLLSHALSVSIQDWYSTAHRCSNHPWFVSSSLKYLGVEKVLGLPSKTIYKIWSLSNPNY